MLYAPHPQSLCEKEINQGCHTFCTSKFSKQSLCLKIGKFFCDDIFTCKRNICIACVIIVKEK